MIGSVTAATSPTAGASSALGQLGSDAFLKLLVAQLRYQNPMAPTDASAMMQQTAQFTQVETLQQMAKSQQLLLGLQQVTIAADLVGKEVTAKAMDGQEVSGTVDAVRFTDAGTVLRVGERDVLLDQALEIRAPAARA